MQVNQHPDEVIDNLEAQLAEAQREIEGSHEIIIEQNEEIVRAKADAARLRNALEVAESQLAGWVMCPKCGRVVSLVYPNHSPNPEDMGICRLSLRPVAVLPEPAASAEEVKE